MTNESGFPDGWSNYVIVYHEAKHISERLLCWRNFAPTMEIFVLVLPPSDVYYLNVNMTKHILTWKEEFRTLSGRFRFPNLTYLVCSDLWSWYILRPQCIIHIMTLQFMPFFSSKYKIIKKNTLLHSYYLLEFHNFETGESMFSYSCEGLLKTYF